MDRAALHSPQAIDLGAERPFDVGGATIDPLAHEAQVNGQRERLQPQNLKVLIALVRARGRVLTRDQIVELCWDGRFIGDDVINRAISTLRQFAERAGGFTIETIPRAGYRLVEQGRQGAARLSPFWLVGSAAILLASAATVLLMPWSRPHPPPPPTIALLPFTTADPDPKIRGLAAATHDTLAHMLAQGAFAVIVVDSPPQGRSPAADFVISGELTGNAEKVVATVRMDETAHDYVVFSHQFDATSKEASGLPERVGAQVAAQLWWLEPLLVVERRHPSDPAIIASVLQASAGGLIGAGLLHDYETSRRLAAQAPNSPLAQASFADNTAFVLDQLPREERATAVAAARHAADRAIALAPENEVGYNSWCLLQNSVRLIECEDKLLAALRADRDASWATWFLSSVLNEVGRNREAFDLARLSLAHDPYMLFKIARAIEMSEETGRTDEAERLYQQSTRWWPGSPSIVGYGLSGIAVRGDFKAMRQFGDEHGDPSKLHTLLAAIESRSLPVLRSACASAGAFSRTVCMLGLARLGDLDGAFAMADQVYPSRIGRSPADAERIWLDSPDVELLAFITSPAAAPLRRDPRYLALAERTGLLRYWRSGRLPDFCTDPKPEPICAQIRGR